MIQNPANSQNPQQPAQQTKKKVRQNFTLKPEHFQKQNGLEALYKAIQHLDLTKGEDLVQQSMKKIVVTLKTWHFQMLPKYSFDYFLQRCRVLGNNKFTQSYMTKVRKIHKGQDSWNNQPVQNDQLNNVNLDHLNPHQNQLSQKKQTQQQSLDKKVQRAMKIVNQISSGAEFNENNGRKMQVQAQPNHNNDLGPEQDDDSDVDELFRQMDKLQKQKKELFSKKKQSLDSKRQQQQKNDPSNANKQFTETSKYVQEDQVPYIPEGFDEIDYAQQSSQFQG